MITQHPAFIEMISRLTSRLNPLAIHLFGSHARGDAGPDSDVDLLVVVKESNQPRYKRAQMVRTFISDIGLPKDVIIMTQKEWDNESTVPVSLVSTVIKEGLKLDLRS